MAEASWANEWGDPCFRLAGGHRVQWMFRDEWDILQRLLSGDGQRERYDWTVDIAGICAAIWKAKTGMSHERLVRLIHPHQQAIESGQEPLLAHETIRRILHALDTGQVTEGQALRLLRFQAQRLSEEPAHATLYRQAAAGIQQMQREEQEHARHA